MSGLLVDSGYNPIKPNYMKPDTDDDGFDDNVEVDVEKFESDGYRFLVIKNMLVAYADEKGHTGYILANGEMSDKSVTNLIGFDWIEEPYSLLWENQ